MKIIFTHFIFFFNDTATTEIYTLSLHDALPIRCSRPTDGWPPRPRSSSSPGTPPPAARGRWSRSSAPPWSASSNTSTPEPLRTEVRSTATNSTVPPYWPTGPEAAVHGWATPDWASGSAGCSPSRPRAWTIPRLWHALGRPQLSLHTLHRRVRAVAAWRRPRLIAKGDPDRDQILADLQQQIRDLPDGAVVLAEDETHINLLPWVGPPGSPEGLAKRS